MKTTDLIDTLARGAPHERAAPPWAAVVLAGLTSAMLLMALTLGPRPDIAEALAPTFLKAALGAAVAAAALPLVVQLASPGRPGGVRIVVLAAFGVAALAAALIVGWDGYHRIIADRPIPRCLIYIPLFATPMAALLLWLVRGRAPTRLTLIGAAIGAASGGAGAMAYAVYCPFENYLTVLSWYVMGISICAALGALVAGRLLRW